MMDIDEAVEKYIRCHELQTASACGGDCDGCEFDIPDEIHKPLYDLHEYINNNKRTV